MPARAFVAEVVRSYSRVAELSIQRSSEGITKYVPGTIIYITTYRLYRVRL